MRSETRVNSISRLSRDSLEPCLNLAQIEQERLGVEIWNQFALERGDHVLEQQFAFL
jgi:hypothetical protein